MLLFALMQYCLRSSQENHLTDRRSKYYLKFGIGLLFDMLVGSAILEEFIDHIERDDLVRLRWLKRIRETGFDQALSEYRETLNRLRQS